MPVPRPNSKIRWDRGLNLRQVLLFCYISHYPVVTNIRGLVKKRKKLLVISVVF